MQRKRTQGRELALQLLYQVDLLRGLPEPEQQRFLTEHAEGADQRAFGESLVKGVLENQAAIDVEIEEVAKNWELGRMAIIDRNILRIGVLELCYRSDEIPPKVAINEAVDLAKKYSSKNSSAFVNGILDRVRERFEEAKARAAPAPAPGTDRP
jgi:N utilization substance protein B